MPVQKSRSSLVAKLGERLKKGHEAHKNDDTEYSSFGDLPAGIENGVAQLVDCKFTQIKEGKENAGQYMFYAAGVVKSPTEVNADGQVIEVEGLRTQVSEPLFDTPTRTRKTVEDHLGFVYNELRKLGVDTKQIGPDDLESVAAALKESQPHFKFRTWKGAMQTTGAYAGREPRTQHQWNGQCQWNGDGGGDSVDVVDDTGAVEPDITETTTTFDEFGDLGSLVEAANAQDEEAATKLKEMALAAGVEEADVDAAGDWQEVADMITAAGAGAEETVEPEGPADPEVGQVFSYKPLDPKTKKPVKKSVQVEVISVDDNKKTVGLKNLATPKVIYKGVKWDALEEAE